MEAISTGTATADLVEAYWNSSSEKQLLARLDVVAQMGHQAGGHAVKRQKKICLQRLSCPLAENPGPPGSL
jgi:hypothetical protein